MSQKFIIFHSGCSDGFASAWIMHKFYPEAEFYPGVYQEDPPLQQATDKDVYLLDFSYKRDALQQLCEVAHAVIVFDHHKSAFEDIGTLQHPKLSMIFDMEHCGCVITWLGIVSDIPVPKYLRYIEDRDLWRKLLPDTDEFSLALKSYPHDFAVWDALFENFDGSANVQSLIAQGHHILRAYTQQKELIKKQCYKAALAGYSCAVVNAPYFFASEVASEIISDDAEFGASYFERADGKYQYSLRSIGDFDVAKIAELYGGGGHKNAAGFTVDQLVHTHSHMHHLV